MAFFPEGDPAGRIVVDPIHGDIRPTAREWGIVDTGSFQRLRHLKQLQMGDLTYPNATHTRFAHSLGTLGIMARILGIAERKCFRLSVRQHEDLRAAALLHDIGHYPYSHLMEGIDKVRLTEEEVDPEGRGRRPLKRDPYPGHAEVGRLIVMNQKDLLEAIGGKDRARSVADFFTRSKAFNPQLCNLIHSSLDMDRLDYLLRDSQAAGVPYGQIDVNYLLNNVNISPSGMLGFTEKAMPAAEHFLFARFFMHRTVYYHKTTYAIEEACRQLLRRIRDAGKHGIPHDGKSIGKLVKSSELRGFTDAFVDGIIQRAAADEDRVVRVLARAILDRRPPKLLKEVCVFEEKATQHHAGLLFLQNCRHKLQRLSRDFSLPLGRFLLCQTPPLTLETRGSLITAGEARSLLPEEEEDLVKVFVGDEEPRPIVEVQHSLVRSLSGCFFQAFRLYFVADHNADESILRALRQKVASWDRPG